MGKITTSVHRRAVADRDSRDGIAGFTLLELLVVLVILGLLVGLVAPQAMQLLGSSKQKVAAQSVVRLAGILDIYKLDIGSYPTTEQGLAALVQQPAGVPGWNGPYVKGDQVPTDPWGRPFQYRAPRQRPRHDYDLFTLGADNSPGGAGEAADVFNP